MTRNEEGALSPKAHAMESVIRRTITMHDEQYSRMRFGHLSKLDMFHHNDSAEGKAEFLVPLVLPQVPDHRRVIYAIYEYDPLLDSSNMTMDDWIQIAKDIKDAYEMFDGFVILHGTWRIVRDVTGLLSFDLCLWIQFCGYWLKVCGMLFYNELTILRYLFIVIWKRMKVINDELLALILGLSTMMVSGFISIIPFMAGAQLGGTFVVPSIMSTNESA